MSDISLPEPTETAIAARWQPLVGGTVIWVFMTVEVLTFGMFLLWHAASWRQDPAGFAAAQAHLDVASGALGTVLLVLGSAAAYLAVLARERGANRRAAGWLLAGAGMGVLFTLNKLREYAPHLAAGLSLSSHPFWFSYYFLTFLHLLHVIAGVVVFCVLAWRARRGTLALQPIEAGAAYWHLVDVIWLLLFSILYGMHP